MFEHFTDTTRRVITLAESEAKRLGLDYVGPEHVLLGLIAVNEGIAFDTIRSFGITLQKARRELEKLPGMKAGSSPKGLPLSISTERMLKHAHREMRERGESVIDTEHMLLALLRAKDRTSIDALINLGARPHALHYRVARAIATKHGPDRRGIRVRSGRF